MAWSSARERRRRQAAIANTATTMTQKSLHCLVRPAATAEVKKTAIQSAASHGKTCRRRGRDPRPYPGRHIQIWHDGLSRAAYGRFYAAQVATPWGRAPPAAAGAGRRRRGAGQREAVRFDAALDGRPIQVGGHRRGVHARRRSRPRRGARARSSGCSSARPATAPISRCCFPRSARTTTRASASSRSRPPIASCASSSPTRYGAPMTMVRGGDDRDLQGHRRAGPARAAPYRFHLNRDRDLVQFAIARKRLLAGLGAAGVRAGAFLHRGGRRVRGRLRRRSACAGSEWTLEEAGRSRSGRRARRRDPAGADRARAGREAAGDHRAGCPPDSCRRR